MLIAGIFYLYRILLFFFCYLLVFSKILFLFCLLIFSNFLFLFFDDHFVELCDVVF